MFIGRENEIKKIQDFLNLKTGAMLIYGQRRVGKTTLILEALKNSKNKTAYYECSKSPFKTNLQGLEHSLVSAGILEHEMDFNRLQLLFEYLNMLNQPINIVIDEYSYLYSYEHADTIDSIFQNIIDTRLSNIHLFISGSNISLMKQLLYEKDPLFGRFKMIIDLKPLDYKTCSLFYPNVSVRDKIAFYSVFGGLPFSNKYIDEKLSLKENIINCFLDVDSPLFLFLDKTLLSEFTNELNADEILSIISNGKKRYSVIEQLSTLKSAGNLAKQLNALLSMDILNKNIPLNKSDDKKKTLYEIKDNLIRFYYTFIKRNKSALVILNPNVFYDKYIQPTLNTFISYRFEQQCREYFILQCQKGIRDDIYNIGTYYYDDKKNKTNGEFDVALKKDNDKYDIYEVKFYQDLMTKSEMENEINQIRNIKDININNMGFICSSGFKDKIDGCELISGKQLYDF